MYANLCYLNISLMFIPSREKPIKTSIPKCKPEGGLGNRGGKNKGSMYLNYLF